MSTLQQDLKLLRKLKEEQYNRLKNQPHRYYVPIGKGQEFIDKVSSGENITILLEAANGIGKTMLMANILANLFWPVKNKHFQGKLFQEWKYPKHGRIVSDPNTVKETIIPMLKQVFPKGRYSEKVTVSKDGKSFESHWSTDTGWDFNIMTYEQEVKEFESATLGFVWCDEPPPQAIYNANYARLRMGGVIFITETPLSGSQWLYDDFIELSEEKRKEQGKAIVQAEIEDACKEHGVNGFLEHQQIERMVQGYDVDERQARAFGKHAHLSGLIFKKWNEGIHIIPPFKLEEDYWLVVHALDPHPRVNDAGLWVAFGIDRRVIVCDELWFEGSTEELAIHIKGINKNYRMSPHMLIDPSSDVVDKHTGHSLRGDLKIEGLDYELGSKSRTEATRVIKDKINFIYRNGLFIKKPELYSFETNEHFNFEMKHWQWEDWQGKSAAYKTLKEKPVDKNDHFIECLGRILLSGLHYETPIRYNEDHSSSTLNVDPYA